MTTSPKPRRLGRDARADCSFGEGVGRCGGAFLDPDADDGGRSWLLPNTVKPWFRTPSAPHLPR